MKWFQNVVILILIVIIGGSCGEYQRIYKKGTVLEKQSKAMELYNKKEYSKSVQLLEQLRDLYKVRDSLENVYYHMAMSYYHLKDYTVCVFVFQRLHGELQSIRPVNRVRLHESILRFFSNRTGRFGPSRYQKSN